MPKKAVDYSKTIIYKIQHSEKPELLYVGHTTEFTKRKSQHRTNSTLETSRKYNYKLYTMIRDNGGWEMFSMIQIKEFSCTNSREACSEEDKHMTELKASLNSKRAYNELPEREYMANYRATHKEEKTKQDKAYREANNDYIKEFKRQPHKCECGKTICHDEQARHKRSQFHTKYLTSQQSS